MHIHAQRKTLAILALALPMSFATAAVTSSQIVVPIMKNQPVVDGKISAEEIANSASVKLQKNASLDLPTYATTAYVGATLEGIYFGFIADEPNLDAMTGADTARNGPVFKDDSVQVFITPTIDTASDAYYHFAVNPFGVAYSSHLIARTPVDGWQVATATEAQNGTTHGTWSAEFFIPLKTISAPDELPFWRANLARVRPARGDQPAETTAWQDTGISLFNYRKFGFLKMPRLVPAPPVEDAADADSATSGGEAGLSTATLTARMAVMPTPAPAPGQPEGMPVSQPTAQ